VLKYKLRHKFWILLLLNHRFPFLVYLSVYSKNSFLYITLLLSKKHDIMEIQSHRSGYIFVNRFKNKSWHFYTQTIGMVWNKNVQISIGLGKWIPISYRAHRTYCDNNKTYYVTIKPPYAIWLLYGYLLNTRTMYR